MTITAAADGSALGNPGPAGWAWYVDDTHWAAGGWKHATNNQGELKAVLELFRATEHLDDDLLVLCDSQYVINCVTKWMRGWKAKGWRKGDGKPVMNLELLREIDEAIVGRRYRFEWVKGHANHPLNEAADVRARSVAEAFQRGASIPGGPGWAGDAHRVVEVEPDPAPAMPTAAIPDPVVAQPELFSFDDEVDSEDAARAAHGEPVGRTVQVSLDAQDYARLEASASRRGISVPTLLAELIRSAS